MSSLRLPTLEQLRQSASALGLRSEEGAGLKWECRLPTGSYKIRGVREYFRQEGRGPLRVLAPDPSGEDEGGLPPFAVRVLSAGNLALAFASECRARGWECRAVVPDKISSLKRANLEALGARMELLPFERIWEMVQEDPARADFVHPFHPALLTGYGTIALELLDRAGSLVIPFGLGGLAAAVTHALEVAGSALRVVLCEVEGHAPMQRALAAGAPEEGPRLVSYIEVLGTPCALPAVFDFFRARRPVIVTVTQDEVSASLLELHQRHGQAVEGAAAAAWAASRKLGAPSLALLTGANLAPAVLHKLQEH